MAVLGRLTENERKGAAGPSLAFQWLRLHASTVGAGGFHHWSENQDLEGWRWEGGGATAIFLAQNRFKNTLLLFSLVASQDRKCWGSSSYNVCSIWIPISLSPNVSILMKLLDSPSRGLNDSR